MRKAHPLGLPAQVRSGGSTGLVGSFGMTRDGGTVMHKGTDYLCDLLDPVYAAHDGTIARTGFEWNSGQPRNVGYGKRIVLQGKDSVETRYAHLSFVVHGKGMDVHCGELIGLAGKTGNAYGGPCHVHFEVRLGGEPVNPDWWLTGQGKRLGVEAHDLEV